jgi:hypothetical protein
MGVVKHGNASLVNDLCWVTVMGSLGLWKDPESPSPETQEGGCAISFRGLEALVLVGKCIA